MFLLTGVLLSPAVVLLVAMVAIFYSFGLLGRGAGHSASSVVFVISDHGMGHAGRNCAILAELLARGQRVHVVSRVPASFFLDYFREFFGAMDVAEHVYLPLFRHLTMQSDVGLIQRAGIAADLPATVAALRSFWLDLARPSGTLDRMVDALTSSSDQIADWQPAVVVFDVSAVGPLLADRLGVPSVAASNFDWVDIYAPFVDQRPDLAPFVARHRHAYRRTDYLLSLAFACPMAGVNGPWLKEPALQLPLTGRRSPFSRRDARRMLLGEEGGDSIRRRIMMVSFGGHRGALTAADIAKRWRVPDGWLVVVPGAADNALFLDGAVRQFNRSAPVPSITTLVAASDVLIGKPGFGFTSECILHDVAMLYVRRDQFAEQDLLIAGLTEYGLADETDEQSVLAGHVFSQAERLLDRRKRASQSSDAVQPEGNRIAVDFILDKVDRRR